MRSIPGLFRMFLIVFRILISEYRNTWFYHIFLGMLLPVGLAILLKSGSTTVSFDKAIFLLGGNMVISIVFGPTVMLITKIGWGKEFREFDYWASLPVSKVILIVGMASVYFVFAIPGLLVSYGLGSWIFHLPLLGSLWLIVLAALGVLSLSGFGAMIGTYAKNGQLSSIYGNALIAIATFISPLIIPQESMPELLRLAAYALPTTYVADAFRKALVNDIGLSMLVDASMLIFFTLLFFRLVHSKLDWRNS